MQGNYLEKIGYRRVFFLKNIKRELKPGIKIEDKISQFPVVRDKDNADLM